MATTTDQSAFDSAPAFIEANGVVVYKGTVAELRAAARGCSHVGMVMWLELLSCVEDFCVQHEPNSPRPLAYRRVVIDLPCFVVSVGVGYA